MDETNYTQLSDPKIRKTTDGVSGAHLIAVELHFQVKGKNNDWHIAWDSVWFPKQACKLEGDDVFVCRSFLQKKQKEIAETNNYFMCGIAQVDEEE